MIELYGDYHTHTRYSHGKGTIKQNAEAAKDRGLKELAITDHGFQHGLYGVSRDEYKIMREEIDGLNQDPSLKILLGVEANILSLEGDVDVEERDLEMTDILLLGYHKIFAAKDIRSVFSFFIPSFVNSVLRWKSDKARLRNTEAFIRAMDKYPIDIIVHPGFNIDVDYMLLAHEAGARGVYLELNANKNCIPGEVIQRMTRETDVQFIINSDAHSPDRVGVTDAKRAKLEGLGLSPERICNISAAPLLRSAKRA